MKIRLKNGSYGFIYAESLPECGFSEFSIPTDLEQIAITGDYYDIANNHCAAICTMNIVLTLKKQKIGGLENLINENDRLQLFQSIHRFVRNGPVIFYKPKINRYLKSIGSQVKMTPIKKYEDIEKAILEKRPVAMLLNAGITLWHWVLVIGIRKYMDGSIYLNILDGWNKRSDRYLKFDGRDTFIRALKPIW